jgi:hypothetical protein
MAALTEVEKARRRAIMAELRTWLQNEGRNQRWLGEKLGIYHGYVSNLLTGKQVAGGKVIEDALKLMRREPVKPKRTLVKRSVESRDNRQPKARPKRKKIPKRRVARQMRPLDSHELLGVVSMTQAFLNHNPGVDSEQLVMVVRGIREGLTTPS